MLWSQKLRAKMLRPLLEWMSKIGVTPNHLTIASLVTGLIGAFLLAVVYKDLRPVGMLFILLHVILDGMDGPLARHKGVESNRGSFIDTACDQIVITAVTISLVYIDVVHAISGLLYALIYTVVVGFAMVRNALNIPYSWLVRPRFFVYMWIPIEFYIASGTLPIILNIFIVLLFIKAVSGYFKIIRKI